MLITMDLIQILLVFAFTGNIVLTFIIFLAFIETRRIYLLSFSTFAFSLFLWGITIYNFREASSVEQSIYWARLLYATASFIPLTFAFFTRDFLLTKSSVFNTFFGFGVIAAVAFALLSLYGDLVYSVEFNLSEEKTIIFKDGYFLFNIYIPALFMISFIQLWKKLVNSTKIQEKKQISTFLYGSLLVSSIGMTTNLVLPTLGVFTFNWMGQVSTIFWLTIIIYSIFKHSLFEIRFIFARLIYFALGAIIVLFIYYLALAIQVTIFGNPQDPKTIILAIPIALLFIYIYDNYKNFVTDRISANIINPGWDPKEEIVKFNEEVGKLLMYQEIILLLKNTLRATVNPIEITIYVDLEHGEKYIDPVENISKNTDNIKNLMNWCHKIDYYPLMIDELELYFPRNLEPYKDEIEKVIEDMKANNIQIILPIYNVQKVSGLMMLSRKHTGGIYTAIQRRFLQGLCATTALALTRSSLYEEVKDFNESLQQKINQATIEIAEKNAKLEESLRVERDMLDILGHELRTPITTVRNILGTIKIMWDAKTLDDDKMNLYLDMANENIRREVSLLETILASAKIDNDKLDLNREKVDAKDVVEDSILAHARMAESKGLELINEIPDEEILLIADRIRIQQVLDNLVSNALKYTKYGKVTIKLEQSDDTVTMSVTDTGEGISAEDLNKLGQKFFRVKNFVKSEGKLGDRQIVRPGGTGIGLYVVFQLVKAMQGKIEVTSQLGEGSTFSVILPRYSPEKLQNMLSITKQS